MDPMVKKGLESLKKLGSSVGFAKENID